MATDPKPGTDFDVAVHPAALAPGHVHAWGFDYAWEDEPTLADLISLLKANECQFACRYLSDAIPGGKGLTLAEAQALSAAGIRICMNWETTGVTFEGGYAAGLSDGQQALAAARVLGAPSGALIWFSVDAGTADYPVTNDYLRGAKAGTAEYTAQLYGSYGVVEAAAAAGLGSQHWQTYAWSGGQLSSHAALYQYQNGVQAGPVQVDRDQALQASYGGWLYGTQPPGWTEVLLSELPTLAPGATGNDVRSVQGLCGSRGHAVAIDGDYGPLTTAAVKAVQAAGGITQDGITGPATWPKLLNR